MNGVQFSQARYFYCQKEENYKRKNMGFINNNTKKQVKEISGVLVYTLREQYTFH